VVEQPQALDAVHEGDGLEGDRVGVGAGGDIAALDADAHHEGERVPDIPFPNKPREQDLWNGWAPHRFHGPLAYQGLTLSPPIEVAASEPRNRGARLAVWNDDPTTATEHETAAGIAPRLRSMAQRTWGTPDPVVDYAEFQRLMADTAGPSTRWSQRCRR
jgi:hypothetical protein